MRIRTVLITAGVLAVVGAPTLAVAANNGTNVLGGQRNPTLNSSKSYSGETQIIAQNDTYGTRQSNKGGGGGAIYGCRSAVNMPPCIRTVNMNQGHAFEFFTRGLEGGTITVGNGGAATRPFTTNATGVATGLNADKVDGKSADEIAKEAVATAVASATDASAKAATALVATTNQTAQVSDAGVLSKARGAAKAEKTATGVYDVTFSTDVSACLPTATVGGTAGGQLSVTQPSPTVVHVTTFDKTGTAADSAFSLLVTC